MLPSYAKRLMLAMPLFLVYLLLLVGGKGVEAVVANCGSTSPSGGHCSCDTNILLNCDGVSAGFSGRIFLHKRGLTSIQEGVFDHLTSLTWLYLFDNNLGTLSATMFDNLTNLVSL
jgi:hypothetical protein